MSDEKAISVGTPLVIERGGAHGVAPLQIFLTFVLRDAEQLVRLQTEFPSRMFQAVTNS